MKKKFNLIANIIDCWCENEINRIYFIIKVNEKMILVERGIIDYTACNEEE